MLAIYIKKLQHKSHTLTPTLAHAHLRATLTHSHTNFGCCIKNNIVVWSTKIRKFIQRIAFGVMATAKSEANPRSFLLRFPFPTRLLCLRNRKDKASPSTWCRAFYDQSPQVELIIIIIGVRGPWVRRGFRQQEQDRQLRSVATDKAGIHFINAAPQKGLRGCRLCYPHREKVRKMEIICTINTIKVP